MQYKKKVGMTISRAGLWLFMSNVINDCREGL